MKAEEILKQVQKMYRSKRFELDEEKENIIEYKWHNYERGGHYFTDDSYTESHKEAIHFCTVEFARRLLTKTIAQNPRIKAIPKNKSRLKIFNKIHQTGTWSQRASEQ